MKNKMLLSRLLTVFLALSLCFPLFPFVKADVSPEGNVAFQPNVIPELSISFVEEFFRFQWLGNRFDLKLLIAYNDAKGLKLLSLKDFWEKDKKAIKWREVCDKATESMYEFGYMIDDIPSEIAGNVEYLVWKIEGASFNEKDIEVKEIDSFVDLGYNITRFHLPDNLVLSYEDLWLYDFVVSHPSKLETKVEGVKGKSSLDLDPIVFSGGVITITDYDTEGTACDHEEVWTQIANETIFAKQGDKQYYSNALIVTGNGTGTTWFVDSSVQVEFNSSVITANYQNLYEVKANSNLRFGVVLDATSKRTGNGVSLLYYDTRVYHTTSFVTGANVYLYSCHFDGGGYFPYDMVKYIETEKNIWNCYLLGCCLTGSNIDAFNVEWSRNSAVVGAIRRPTGGTFEKLRMSTIVIPLYFYTTYGVTVTNLYGRGLNNIARAAGITVDSYFIDFDVDSWTFWGGLTGTGEIYRQYSFDLTVTFPNGTAVNGATVTIKHYGQTETTDFSGNTNATGQIPQQTLSMGFYNQTGGNTLYSYNPHELNITYSGYDTYLKNVTLSEKTTWEISLTETTTATTGFDSTYYLLGLATALPFLLLTFAYGRKREREQYEL